MIDELLSYLFGCRHKRCTWPISPKNSKRPAYVVCLDCGREFAYNWPEMKRDDEGGYGPATGDHVAIARRRNKSAVRI